MEAICESPSCPVTAVDAICELSSCPVTAVDAICELLPCLELDTEANNEPSFAHVTAYELLSCRYPAEEAAFELPVPSVTTEAVIGEFPDSCVALLVNYVLLTKFGRNTSDTLPNQTQVVHNQGNQHSDINTADIPPFI